MGVTVTRKREKVLLKAVSKVIEKGKKESAKIFKIKLDNIKKALTFATP